MKTEIHILMLEDNEADAELMAHTLRKAGIVFSSERVETRADFMRALESGTARPDVILSDYSLPSFDGYRALAIAQAKCPDAPFIFVTGTLGEEVAIETFKQGATDYVLKQRLNRLVPSVQRALREAEERIRIAREVHDELGQALTGLKLQLSWLCGRLPKKLKRLREKTKTLAGRVDETIQTVRRIATELRPGVLDSAGLVAALEWQASQFENQTGIRCRVKSIVQETLRDQASNTAFFRIFQETLTNVIRHAHATRVDVRFAQMGHSLVLVVKDNGRGISEAEIHNTKFIGLLGIRERAALLGGEVRWRGEPNRGTTVLVRIPRPQKSRALIMLE